MKMKRILALLLVSVFLLGTFVGCNKKENTGSSAANSTEETASGDFADSDSDGIPDNVESSDGDTENLGSSANGNTTESGGNVNNGGGTINSNGSGNNGGGTAEKMPYYDVTAYGAKKDGSADASKAIQKAIDAAYKNHGGIVYLPAGRYLMKAGVDVPMGVSIRGETPSTKKKWRAVANLGTKSYSFEGSGNSWLDADNFAGTWMIVDHGAGNVDSHPTFQMQGNASIIGLGFVHKNTAPITTKITVYPPAIGIANTTKLPFTREGMTVENIMLLNAYIGIAFHAGNGKVLDHEIGTSWESTLKSLGRMRVHNVTGGCTYRGIILKGLLDTVDIQNVRFGYTNLEKTYATQRAQQCADFEWYRADGSDVMNIFSFGAKYGILSTPAYNSGSTSMRLSKAELLGQYPVYFSATGQYELTNCTFTTMNFNNLVKEKDFHAMTVIQDTTSIHQPFYLFNNLKLVNNLQSTSLNDYNLYLVTKHAGAPAMTVFSDITFEGWSPDSTNAVVYYETSGSSYGGYASFYNCTVKGGNSSAGRLIQYANLPKGGAQFNKCQIPQGLIDRSNVGDFVWVQG